MNSNKPQCSACSGAGAISSLTVCSQCRGTGTTSTPVACANCAGSGTHNGRTCGSCRNPGRRPIPSACSTCNGTGSYTSTLLCSTCAQRPLEHRPTDSSYFTFGGTRNISRTRNTNTVRRRNYRVSKPTRVRRRTGLCRNRRVRSSTWVYARDVRAQVANAPAPLKRGQWGYPSYFGNKKGLPMQASAPLQHIPIVPGETTTHTAANDDAGRFRAFYNDNDRGVFDVGYRDPKAAITAGGSHEFSLGHYHSAKVASVDENVEDDTSKVGDSSEDPNSTEDVPLSDN